jgi:PIN like domain
LKFLIDNNLPPQLARALHELSKPYGHEVVPLKEKFPPSTADSVWIGDLKSEGNWVIISQDNFRKGDLEKAAIRSCGLPIFCLSKQWVSQQYWAKAHNLVRWWPAITEQANLISGGAAFRVPWKYGAKPKFEQIKI